MTAQHWPAALTPRPASPRILPRPERTTMTTDQNPTAAAVCICGHSERQHFEDACITEITGCDCGDYLEPDAAREVIARWRTAALNARAAAASVPPPADQTASGSGRAAEAELYVLLRKAGEPRDEAQALIDRHRAEVLRRVAAEEQPAPCGRPASIPSPCSAGDHCCEGPPAAEEQPAETQWPGERCMLCPPGTRTRHLEDHMGQVHGARPSERPAAEEQPAETRDSLHAWLYQRFMPDGVGWESLNADDRSYWDHQARAVRRAVARGGFKADAERPAVGEQPEAQEAPVRPCNYWTHTRIEHTPHRWEPQPGMDPVHCPGYSRTPE